MRKTTAFLLLFLILIYRQATAQIVWADSCVSNSFYGKISGDYGFSTFERVLNYPGGDVIALGSVSAFDSVSNRLRNYGLVIRLNPAGKLVWSRFIGFHGHSQQSDTRMYAATLTANGDIAVSTYNSLYGYPGGNIVVRLNGNGNLIWAKRVQEPVYLYIIEDIVETSDGGFLLGGPTSTLGLVSKLDASGNLLWYQGVSNHTYVNCRSVAESPSAYYFTGYSYDFSFDSSRNLLVKMDKQSGNIGWIRSFGDASKQQGLTEYAFDKMDYRNGLLRLVGSTSVNYSGANRSAQAAVSFDESGNVVSALRIENLSIQTTAASLFKGSLYDISARAGVQYRFSDSADFYVYHLNGDNSPQYSWRLQMPAIDIANACTVLSDTSLLVVGYNQFALGINGVVVKTSPQGKLENCTSSPVSLLTTPITLTARNWAPAFFQPPSLDSTRYTEIKSIAGYGFSFNFLCADSNACLLSKITGPVSVCSSSLPVYKVTRKGNCNTRVRFSVTGNASIAVLSDTSVTVSFSSVGTYKLTAEQDASCRILRDSVMIEVSNGAPSVSLGSDTVLCVGSQITLQPGGNFASFLWQDGSTASSYVVTKGGLYFVAATDFCGHVYKDSVFVSSVTSVPINLGPDRTKCNNDTLRLNAPAGFMAYTWSNNYNISSTTSQNVVVNPSVDTAYYIKAEKTPGCFAYDTVRIKVYQSPPIDLGNDKSFCLGDSAVFDAGAGFQTYAWSGGQSNQRIAVKTAGTYSVVGTTAQGCKSADTVKVLTVYSLPSVSLDKKASLCFGDSKTLNAGNFASYSWSTGQNTATIVVNAIGQYAVAVADANGCKGSDTTAITTINALPTGFLPLDTAVCSYGSVQLKPLASFSRYLWSTGDLNASITVSKPGLTGWK